MYAPLKKYTVITYTLKINLNEGSTYQKKSKVYFIISQDIEATLSLKFELILDVNYEFSKYPRCLTRYLFIDHSLTSFVVPSKNTFVIWLTGSNLIGSGDSCKYISSPFSNILEIE